MLMNDFNDIPTLRFITSHQFAIRLWNLRTIVNSISGFLDGIRGSHESHWKEIENKVKSIAESTVKIPGALKKDLHAIIIPTGLHIREMRTFAYYSPDIKSFDVEFPVKYWTLYGTVDTKQVEKILVMNQRMCIGFRYALACNDCFEDVIKELFRLVSSKEKKHYKRFVDKNELQSYWTHRMLKDVSDFRRKVLAHFPNINQSDYTAEELAFMCTLKHRNKAGIEYFLNSLPRHRFDHIADKHFSFILDGTSSGSKYTLPRRPEEQCIDSFYFLLSKLNENIRGNILKRKASYILLNFLRYPFFGLFSKYVNSLMCNLNAAQTLTLLQRILQLESLNVHFFGYEHLFKDLWHICPEEHKVYVRDIYNNYVYLRGRENMRRAITEAERSIAKLNL